MGDQAKTEKAPTKSWFEGLKSEFNKIVWPDKKTLGKETGAVVAVSIVLGVLIVVIDWAVQYGLEFLIK